jgi:hypothetical protein
VQPKDQPFQKKFTAATFGVNSALGAQSNKPYEKKSTNNDDDYENWALENDI